MVASGLPGALNIVKPLVPAPDPGWHWSFVGSLLMTTDSPLRWAPLLSGLPANAPDAVAVGEPRPSLMEDQHVARRLATQNDTTYNNEYCCLTVIKRAIVDNDPETAAKIARAFRHAREWAGQHPREAVLAAQAAGYYGAAVPVEASVKAVKSLGFDSQLDPALALERAFKTRIESGAIKSDKTPQELVRLYYRKLE